MSEADSLKETLAKLGLDEERLREALARMGLDKELLDLARVLSQLREDPGLSIHPYFVAQ